MDSVLVAVILNSKFQGEIDLLQWIPMNLSDLLIPFRRMQFPIRLELLSSVAAKNKYKIVKYY